MKISTFFKSLCSWLLFFAILGFTSGSTFATQLATWNFAAWNPLKESRTTAAPTTNNVNVIVSNLVMASGIDASPNYFTDNSLTGTDVTATTLDQAIANNEYFEFTIAPTAGKSLSITSIDISAVSQGMVRTFSLLSSLNGFTSANEISQITTGPGNETNIALQNLTVTGHTSLTSPVTFRIYIYGLASGVYNAMGIGLHNGDATSDLIVNGSSTAPDLLPPTTPGSLAATSVGSTSLRLTWTASTDDNEVTGYDVYNGTALIGSTTKLFYTVYGLTASTPYTFYVIAKDASGKFSTPATLSMSTTAEGAGDVPKLPIGMNIPGLTYYSTCLFFTDAMTATGEMMSWYEGGGWNSETMPEIPRDVNGYPTVLPFTTSDGKQTNVRMMLNNFYSGRYVLTFDGVGDITISGVEGTKISANKYYIDFNGTGQNVWLDITQSTSGNYIKNMKILPLQYENSAIYPTFDPKFLDGLRPFHALRFMDWIGTNGSTQKAWADHITKTYYSQATEQGTSYEYAIELCNELRADAWVTVPHEADDNFITQTAHLWHDSLNANQKVYAEYSNEIWNWQFTQSHYILENAPGHTNSYIPAALAAIGPSGDKHPEKDAWMMARNFRLWKAEFTSANASRLVRVAAVQHGWPDNTRRILDYLFDVDKQGCDVISPGGYFNFEQSDHDLWLTQCAAVTPNQVIDAVLADYDANAGSWTDATAGFANERGVGYMVYEGGQHMQPWQQGEWCYNQAVWDAQIAPKMYDLYMYNFRKMVDPTVNCSLFMAFSYMGGRESKYGSWGHLERMSQIGNLGGYMTIAPKYQALLDANIPKPDLPYGIAHVTKNALQICPNPAIDQITLNFGSPAGKTEISIFDVQGRQVMVKSIVETYSRYIDIRNLKSGVYVLRIVNGTQIINSRFVKK